MWGRLKRVGKVSFWSWAGFVTSLLWASTFLFWIIGQPCPAPLGCCRRHTQSGSLRSLVAGGDAQYQRCQHLLTPSFSTGLHWPLWVPSSHFLQHFCLFWRVSWGLLEERFPAEFQKMNMLPSPLLFGGLPAACLASQLRRNDVRGVYLLSKLQSSFQQNKKKTTKGSTGVYPKCTGTAEYPFSMSCLSQQRLQERLSWPSWWYQLSKPNHGHFMSQNTLVAQDQRDWGPKLQLLAFR